MGFHKKLLRRHSLRRIFYERLTEPIHLNVLSVFVALFGSFRQKVAHDLVLRHSNAFALLKAADQAKELGLSAITVIEFGVAAGAGLMNICLLAQKVSSLTGIDIQVFGFDTGKGMPAPRDYRDHPNMYHQGDFPSDLAALRNILPSNGHLILGELADTAPQFVKDKLTGRTPIGYVSVDVDYYSSTVEALKVFDGPPQFYLPMVSIYLDDINFECHNPFAGELLAINEFNEHHQFRKICRHEFLDSSRIFRNAEWIKHIFTLHVMDHPVRQNSTSRPAQLLENPYLREAAAKPSGIAL
jgi:hypothetical protein